MFFNKQPKIIKCAGCQQKIVGQYINALKKNWHSHCFVCDDCKQPILQKAFTVHKKKVYHQHCFQKKYGKVCAVCGLAINGRYLVNHWGDVYCLMHQNQASCFSCGKIISQRLTGGGVKYANHRYCCQQCHQTAILQARNLEKMKTVAISFLQSMGLKLDYQSIP
ncbi:MAG: hypothetical protein HN826_13775, partial [Methylococcales bacterium]|nr:hypothetical protein [Methylococcales bacterium]